MTKILLIALIEQVLFLEFSSDAEVDPDTAVKQMEALAETLRDLNPAQVQEVKTIMAEIADQYGTEPEKKTFVLRFTETFGLEG